MNMFHYPMDNNRNGGANPKNIDVRRERILAGENNGMITETTVQKITVLS